MLQLLGAGSRHWPLNAEVALGVRVPPNITMVLDLGALRCYSAAALVQGPLPGCARLWLSPASEECPTPAWFSLRRRAAGPLAFLIASAAPLKSLYWGLVALGA